MKTQLIKKIESRKANIAVVGLGYVGLPLLEAFAKNGFSVVGFDIDKSKIDSLLAGSSYIKHIKIDEINKAIKEDRCLLTDDPKCFKNTDAVIICVPTPLNKNREPDLTYVTSSLDLMLPHLSDNQLVSLESTTYPGTTEEVIVPMLEKAGFSYGDNVYVAYSPEREDPGNPNFSTTTIPKVVGGMTETCLEVATALYESVISQVVPVSSPRAAELTKILENTYRLINIALANEMKILADKMDIDIFEVIEAAGTKPFGFQKFYPGPGLGGHCIPIDPFYLSWKAREYGAATRFIELAGDINNAMPSYVIHKLTTALNEHGKAVKNAKILVLGIAYKKNVDDMRESPSVLIMEQLRDLGADLSYSDPFVPSFPKMREHQFDLNSTEITEGNLSSMDAVLYLTNHDSFDVDLISKNSKLIIDTRGAVDSSQPNVVRA